MKLADDTTIVVGQITINDENSHQEEINGLAGWCAENNLLLNVSQTKELITEFRIEEAKTHSYLYKWN